ncbi:DUF2971 domain-containing protein [uncultured Granulicatella sp.]|uniref:DUF2971 domain-containing protein n=1 Tax=uncultured Granulicatella sp. TaxID=316089 RepID=UPI0028D69FC5|nr:DUF2971 domain-containing protein [uncultured Granulicatella sp.]
MDLNLKNEILRIQDLDSRAKTVSEREKVLRSIKALYNQNQSFKQIALLYLNILDRLFLEKEKFSIVDGIIEAKRIYNQHSLSEEVAEEYIRLLYNLSKNKDAKFELDIIGDEARRVYKQHSLSEEIAFFYSLVCLNWSFIQKGESTLKNTINRVKKVYNQYPLSEEIALIYAMMLTKLSQNQEEETALRITAKEVRRIYDLFPHSEEIAINYIIVLKELSMNQYKESTLKKTTSEAKRVYDKHFSSEEIANKYSVILMSLSMHQKNESALKKTTEEEKKVCEQHPSSNVIALRYSISLFCLSRRQKKESELKQTISEAKIIYEKDQSSAFGSFFYLFSLIMLIKMQKSLTRRKETSERISHILKKNDQLTSLIEQYIDDFIFIDGSIANYIENYVRVLSSFAAIGKDKNPLIKSKYNFLFEFYENVSDSEFEKLIEIFSLVQLIKNQLIIKAPDKLTFGHYTSGKVLQILLKQKDKENYSIVSKSRLCNVNYMNDPSEGKVLNQYLQMDLTFQKLSLKPSPWFLMSLTTAIDQLSMWSQYGDRAEGVCLILDSSDFSKVKFSSDIEWLTSRRSSKSKIEELEDSVDVVEQESKDFIYRIGYLTTQGDVDAVLKPEYNTCIADEEIEVINDSLKALKEKVGGIDKVNESALYEKVDECLEEIRYLFKSADYSYESELRVLKYMPLEPDNPNIKIDDSGEFAKLYIERENPIKLSEVIFGPKFPNPENVTPLLYLLDKNIEFRQSDISFR